MPNSSKAELTVDELIATLNHTHLPTLVIEGKDDIIIFRRLEEQSANLTLSVLPVGGRDKVLAVFKRLAEITSGQAIAFVADKDMYVYSTVPAKYAAGNLIFTDGYSIENDAFRDIDCEKLLTAGEKQEFAAEMRIFAHWYALSVSRSGAEIDAHPNRLLNDANERARMTTLNPGENYPQDLYETIIADYKKFIRGKSLFQLFQRRMHNARPARHNRLALMEMAAANPGPFINALFGKAESILVP